MHPTSTICFGSSTGFLLSGLLAVLSGSCALAALPFLCSVLSTAYGLWVSRQERIRRAETERIRDRLLLEALDALQQRAAVSGA